MSSRAGGFPIAGTTTPMVRCALVLSLLAAKPESKTVTLARQEVLTLVAEKHANLLIQKFIEGMACLDGGPFPKAACASMGRDVDEATDADNKAMRDHGPYTTCEILWTTSTVYRSATKDLRNRADRGVAYLQDAGSENCCDSRRRL